MRCNEMQAAQHNTMAQHSTAPSSTAVQQEARGDMCTLLGDLAGCGVRGAGCGVVPPTQSHHWQWEKLDLYVVLKESQGNPMVDHGGLSDG